MGDYEPRGSTDDYGRRESPREEPEPTPTEPVDEPSIETEDRAPEEPQEPTPESAHDASARRQTVEDANGHAVPSRDECQMAMFAHLGGLIGWYFTGGVVSFAVPLAIWLSKKDSSSFVDDQGREALNFQLTALIFAFVVGFFTFVTFFLTAGLSLCLFVPLALLYGVYVLVFGIIASIKANEGVRYRYPFNLRMV